jgi:hypothetical protein
MKKYKNQPPTQIMAAQNLVAKYARQFNKAHIFRDKSKYTRKAKHTKPEARLNVLRRILSLASGLIAQQPDKLAHLIHMPT